MLQRIQMRVGNSAQSKSPTPTKWRTEHEQMASFIQIGSLRRTATRPGINCQYPMSRGLLILAAATALTLPAQQIEFNRDIRPILSDRCFTCHGPDATHRQAGLRFD